MMASAGIDIELVKKVLRGALKPEGAFTQRGLARAAGDKGGDLVRNILDGSNKNPTIRTLSAIAQAMGKDLSVFGLSARPIETTVAGLQRALADALPAMPSNDHEKQARYLAEVVADELGLPPDREATVHDHPTKGSQSKDAPPPSPTT